MEFSIGTMELQRIVKALGVTVKLNTADTTGRILIEASDSGDSVLFLSNNLSTGCMIHTNEVSVKEPGKVSLIFGKIKSFVTSFPPWDGTSGAKTFKFKVDEKSVLITVSNKLENGKTSRGRLKLDNFDSSGIRKPKPFDQPNFVLNSNMFKAALGKVLYAVEPNSPMVALQGINIHFDENNIYFAGTNGKILSEYKVNNVGNLKEGSFILKYDFIMGLRRALSGETQLFFEIDDRVIKVKFDDIMFWGRRIVGHEYPDYSNSFDDFKNMVVIDKEVLMGNLRPFSDVLNEDDYNRFTIEMSDGRLAFRNDVANFTCDVDLEYKGGFIIDLNGQYLLQTVDAIKDDKLIIKFTDENGSFIVDSFNSENQKALIRPIRRRK